jgi:hypothetical protein
MSEILYWKLAIYDTVGGGFFKYYNKFSSFIKWLLYLSAEQLQIFHETCSMDAWKKYFWVTQDVLLPDPYRLQLPIVTVL